jgi:hypothetical protein
MVLLSGLFIYSFRFGSALNPDSFIRMNCRYGPWIFLQMDSACGVYRPYGLVLFHRFCNCSQYVSRFHVCYYDMSGVAYILQLFPGSNERNVEEHVSFKYSCSW